MRRSGGVVRRSLVWLGLLALLAAGCQNPTSPGLNPGSESGRRELIVFAAASLTDAFSEIGELFMMANPGLHLVFKFAGSQQLASQIMQGAPADVFASADKRWMARVIPDGRIQTGAEVAFAANELVVITPLDNPGGLNTLADLDADGLSLVLAAQEVPAGRYAQTFLERAGQQPAFGPGFLDGVLANVVSYETNVRAVLNKVALGEADAGIVYRSDVSGRSKEDVGILTIPTDLNARASYPIAPLLDSDQVPLGQEFIELVHSPQGQEILARHGFLVYPAGEQ